MTLQQYLDLLIKTSLEGGFPSLRPNENDGCAYRSEDGKRCAIGLVIPDNVYREHMEGSPVSTIWTKIYKYLPEGLDPESANRLQYAHDVLSHDEAWNHQKFLAKLRKIPCFKNCLFPEDLEVSEG